MLANVFMETAVSFRTALKAFNPFDAEPVHRGLNNFQLNLFARRQLASKGWVFWAPTDAIALPFCEMYNSRMIRLCNRLDCARLTEKTNELSGEKLKNAEYFVCGWSKEQNRIAMASPGCSNGVARIEREKQSKSRIQRVLDQMKTRCDDGYNCCSAGERKERVTQAHRVLTKLKRGRRHGFRTFGAENLKIFAFIFIHFDGRPKCEKSLLDENDIRNTNEWYRLLD